MLVGTVAALVLLLIRVINAPPAGAGALRVTVPVEAEPPRTLAGLRMNELSTGSAAGVHVGVGEDTGSEVGVGVGDEIGIDVRVGVGDDFDADVGVAVGVDEEAPIHNVPIAFELL
jgi:hypothetical protein